MKDKGLKELITEVSEYLKEVKSSLSDLLSRKYIYSASTVSNSKMKMVIATVTSNSSALINLTDLGASSSNCSGLSVMCTTSNYRVSTPILWSNSNYYVTLFNWNNATPVANKTVSLIVTWFEGGY